MTTVQLLFYVLVSAVSFGFCILVAHSLSNRASFSFLYARSNRFRSIDGIRGFLALSVFIHHFVITYYWKEKGVWVLPPEKIFHNFGSVGVIIFFMITGFLFISKITKKNQKVNWYQLYKSRVFRIMPLYLFALGIITLIVFTTSGFQLKVPLITLIEQYAKWFLFFGKDLNDYSDLDAERIIAGVDWTLKYEWLFYLSLPIVALIIKKFKIFGVVSIILVSIIYFKFSVLIGEFNTRYLIFFCIGGLCSYAVNHYQEILTMINHYQLVSRIVAKYRPIFCIKGKLVSSINLLLMLSAIFYPHTLNIIHTAIISLFFLLTLLGNDLYGLFSLRSSLVLGEISYSIYLIHGIILYLFFTTFNLIDLTQYSQTEFFMLMPLISVIVVSVSAITFLFIEKPGIDIGRRIFIKL
jgi:peptidoglycan/LPS O-acetylase OafA/YrhL